MCPRPRGYIREQNRHAASLEGLAFSKVWIVIKETRSLESDCLGLNPNTVIYSETLGKLFINDFELLFGIMEITTYTL